MRNVCRSALLFDEMSVGYIYRRLCLARSGNEFFVFRAVYFFTRGKHRLLPVAPLDSFLRSVGISENAVVFSYFATGVVFAAVAYILTGGL